MASKAKKIAPREFNPASAEAAFKQLEPVLRALPADDVAIPNSDAQNSAVAALALVDIARDPKRLERLKLLPASLFAADTIEQLELAAWATWFAHTRMLTESAAASGAKVDAKLYEASGQHLNKLLKLLEYHVGATPSVAVELADIKSGTGYQDRASDLTRAALLWEQWREELEGDTRNFAPDDANLARNYAQEILQSLRTSLKASVAEWADLRNRAWSRMSELYNELKSAGEFTFRSDPNERELFVPLRQAVVSTVKARPKQQQEETPTPLDAATAPAVTP